jgi:Leucine-rich repeat (LRR) protein
MYVYLQKLKKIIFLVMFLTLSFSFFSKARDFSLEEKEKIVDELIKINNKIDKFFLKKFKNKIVNKNALTLKNVKITPEMLDVIKKMGWLKKISFMNNDIQKLPDDFFENFGDLDELTIHKNPVKTFGSSFHKITKLTWLSLDCVNFEKLTKNIQKLPLKVLYLSKLPLMSLPDFLGEISTLEELFVHDCENIETLPNLEKLPLKILSLKSLSFKELPKWIGKLITLKYLEITKCYKIEKFPGAFCNLFLSTLHLEELPIQNGQLQWISSQKELNSLTLKSLTLDEFSKSFKSLKKIKHLDLSNNMISKIPDWLSKFEQLKFLFLNENRIKELSTYVFEKLYETLKRLDLKDNKIQVVNPQIFKLLSNCNLDLRDNPLFNKKDLDESLF